MFLETERTSEAIDALAAALALDPGHLNARFNLGYALRRMGEPEATAAEFRRLTERYPNDAGHWIGLGGALLEAAGTPRTFEPVWPGQGMAVDSSAAHG